MTGPPADDDLEESEQAPFTNGNDLAAAMDLLEEELAETEELLAEVTADNGSDVYRGSQKVSKRKNARAHGKDEETHEPTATTLHNWIGLIRSRVGHNAGLRNFAVLCMLSLFVLLLVDVFGSSLNRFVPQDSALKPPHTTSFGGAKNPGHNQYANSEDEDDDGRAVWNFLPKDNAGVEVYSISRENIRNSNGHYWHDPLKSPYASPLYQPTNETKTAQAQFNHDMESTKQLFGAWTQPDFAGLTRPSIFHAYPHRDMPGSDLPGTAWQRDETYLSHFLRQAQGLVKRVQFAIYREYGFTSADDVFRVLTYSEKDTSGDARVSMESGVATLVGADGAPKKGMAFLESRAWEGLVRKLLHAMMTEDEFYVVAAGGPHLYRGHNLWRTQVMQFQQIMEPVFDKLGMRLISRNMGMDASTTVSALGGADVYGETDIFWYIPDIRNTGDAFIENEGQLDLLQRQVVMSGERTPILLTSNPLKISEHSSAWVGNIQPGVAICHELTLNDLNAKHVSSPKLPACEFVNCVQNVIDMGLCKNYKSKCWIERTDWNPMSGDTVQQPNVGFQDQQYANDRLHQLEGRKLAMLVLSGLDEALKRWMDEVVAARLPLSDALWHVGESYKTVRESVRTLERRPGTSIEVPSCEVMLQDIDPMICHMEMHVLTEWSPRVNPEYNRMYAAVIDKTVIFDNSEIYDELYSGVDLLPFEWKTLREDTHDQVGETHLVAIATNEELDTYDSGHFDSNIHPDQDDFDDFFDANDDIAGLTDDIFLRRRVLADATKPKISPDRWTLYETPLGFCDGSSQSTCNRRVGNSCLLSNYNHYRAGFVGHGDSGWIHFSIPVTEGVILLRFDWLLNIESNVYTGMNQLGALPEDFKFVYSINGEVSSMDLGKFRASAVKLAHDLVVHPILVDREMSLTKSGPENFEVGIRIRTSAGYGRKILLSHIYYA